MWSMPKTPIEYHLGRWRSFSRSPGSERGDAAPASHGLSNERLFRFKAPNGQIRTGTDRGEVAARLGGRADLPHAQPAPRRRAGEPLVPARDAAVPVRDAAHGARPQLHDGRRPYALPPPQRLDGA